MNYAICDVCGAHWDMEDNQWVSVKDRLPEEGVYVLVYDGNVNLDNGCFFEIAAHRIFNNGSKFISGAYSLQGITHWMPLPKPPEAP